MPSLSPAEYTTAKIGLSFNEVLSWGDFILFLLSRITQAVSNTQDTRQFPLHFYHSITTNAFTCEIAL